MHGPRESAKRHDSCVNNYAGGRGPEKKSTTIEGLDKNGLHSRSEPLDGRSNVPQCRLLPGGDKIMAGGGAVEQQKETWPITKIDEADGLENILADAETYQADSHSKI